MLLDQPLMPQVDRIIRNYFSVRFAENNNDHSGYPRIGALVCIPPAALAARVDMAVGLIAGVGMVFSAGKNRFSCELFASRRDSFEFLDYSLHRFTQVIGPNSAYSKPIIEHRFSEGLLSSFLDRDIIPGMRHIGLAAEREGLWRRYVEIRVFSVVAMPLCVITRTADAVVGAIAAVAVLFTLGHSDSLNNLARRGLQAPRLIPDLCFFAMKTINPAGGSFRRDRAPGSDSDSD